MKLGPIAMEALQEEVGPPLIPGEDLIVVGSIALSGVTKLLEKKEEELASFFSMRFFREVQKLPTTYGISPDQLDGLFQSYPPDAVFEAGEGGILAALWKLAEASGVGLRLDLRKIPVRQEVIEICERLAVNPYQLSSKGCVLVGMKRGTAFVNACEHQGICAQIVGETNLGNDRLLYSGENVRYLERPKRDELFRFL